MGLLALFQICWPHQGQLVCPSVGDSTLARVGFVTHVLNANTRELLDMACASYVLKEEFREIWHAPNPNAGQWRLSK